MRSCKRGVHDLTMSRVCRAICSSCYFKPPKLIDNQVHTSSGQYRFAIDHSGGNKSVNGLSVAIAGLVKYVFESLRAKQLGPDLGEGENVSI